MTVETLLQVVPTLLKRIADLEKDLKKTKETMGDAIIKLVRKVKKQEGILKKKWMVFTDSDEEQGEKNSSKQRRNLNEA